MATGTIKTIRDRGFGFIHRDGSSDREDLFFHQSAVADHGFERLRPGQQVSFDEEPDSRDQSRQRAVNVRPIGEGDQA